MASTITIVIRDAPVGRQGKLTFELFLLLLCFPHLLVPPAISDTNGNATIIIESNDDPHGVVSFTAGTFYVSEGEFNTVTVTRAAGLFGEVGAN